LRGWRSQERGGSNPPFRISAYNSAVIGRAFAVLVLALGVTVLAAPQLTERPLPSGALNHPSIHYFTRATTDPVARLNARLADGSASLSFDPQNGYLRSILTALHVPIESQMLVMSKTGVQALHTGPTNPRAIYFTDDVTVGYIRGAPLLEFAVQDPEQGVIFYTLDQKPQDHPTFERPKACLQCHFVYSTLHVPGMLARSVFTAPDGLAMGQFGSYDADDRTPFNRRWGGWYVTGTHGAMRHMGNAVVVDREDRESGISDRTLNRTSLEGFFDPASYPSTHSDIVALMVFQHQAHMTNLITRVGWETRITGAVPKDSVDELVDYMVFANEVPLPSPIAGTSGFAEMFAAQGPRDRRGRSLRDLDLQRRLMRYPCSFMVYSPAFRALPHETRDAIFERVFARLAEPDRTTVAEILRDTLSEPTGLVVVKFRSP